MNFNSRVVTRATTAPGRLLGPRFSPTPTHDTKSNQFYRLGSVRHFKIRHVVTNNKKEPAASRNDTFHQEQISGPQRYSRQTLDVEDWRSNLILPPDAYWDRWRTALKDIDDGGLRTAESFVERWSDGRPDLSIRVGNGTNGERKIFECTSEFSMPLLGLRKVVSYGHDKVCLELLSFGVLCD
jgi:hypothetical protein